MKIFNYKEFLRKYDKQHWNRLKNRRTYDFWTLSALLLMFGYKYYIEDTVISTSNKHKFDLIKIYKKHQANNIIDKRLSIKTVKYLLKFIMPKVEAKIITRTHKYGRELREDFLALRTI